MTRDKMTATRKAFEAWASALPREWNVSRCETPRGTLGLYRSVCTEKAWRVWQAAASQQPTLSAEAASVLQALIDFAVERTRHRYKEDCPDPVDHDVRDPDCPVCNAIVRAEKLLTDHTEEDIEMVAVPAGWKLVPIEPTANMLYAGSKWACSLALETYKDMLAAAPEMKP